MTHDYDGSQVLFRQAKARAAAARRFAMEASQQQALGRSGIERRLRERDAVITAVVLTQGAAEGYANWVHLQAGTALSPRDSWMTRWERLAEAAEKLGRPPEPDLSEEQRDFLNLLGAWRNFLLHADVRARTRLRDLLAGSLPEGLSEPDLLTADLAEATLQQAEQIFRWAQNKTGIQAPFLDAAWVAPDEC